MSPVARARALADALLRPDAERVDREGVRRESLRAVADAGLLGLTAPTEVGGGGSSVAVAREVQEVLAGACGSTWFVGVQHGFALQTVLGSGNRDLQARFLHDLASGAVRAGVAFAHLRRPGPPAVRARRADGGWRLDGRVDWVTGWGLVDVVLLGGLSAEDEIVFALLPAAETPGLRASAPLRLAAMQATSTVALELDGLVVADRDVAEVTPAPPWREADRVRTANAGPHTFGLLEDVLRRLRASAAGRGGPAAADLAETLAEATAVLRARAYALLDDVPADEQVAERLQVRAAALALAVQASTALVVTGAGRAMAADAPEQRLAREALFHLVQAQTPDVREATLREVHRAVARTGTSGGQR